jgi:excisionase family DNA binding protein
MDTNTIDRLLTVDDAAQFMGVTSQTVRAMIDRREIVALQLGGQPGRPLRISVSALTAVLRGWETRA